MVGQLLCEMIEDIMLRNQELVSIPIRQRAKFEDWLKFELAKTLRRYYSDTCVEYNVKTRIGSVSDDGEDERADTHKLVDIFFDNVLLELKTPNTNYTNPLCETLTRPITKNIGDIIEDVKKLRGILRQQNLPDSLRGFIAFVMFPIDSDNFERGKWQEHVKRIRENICEADEVKKIIKLDNQIPILIYVVEVR